MFENNNILISSVDNKKVKDFIKLKQKKYRDAENKFIIETENLIKEAYLEGKLEEIYLLSGTSISFEVSVPIYYVTEKVMNKIKNANTSKVMGIASKNDNFLYSGNKYLLLDRISDPGNLGTILRSSAAFGIDTVILSNDCCDLYNDKVIRASEGAIFKLNIIKEDVAVAISNLKKLNINIYGTDVESGKDVRDIPKNNFCVIMGNESSGISNEVKTLVTDNIYIKTENVESLNVAVATSIILYELSKK